VVHHHPLLPDLDNNQKTTYQHLVETNMREIAALEKQITTQEEVDSILSPEYLRIVGQTSDYN